MFPMQMNPQAGIPNNNRQVNPQQFMQLLPNINSNMLNQLVNQARAQGIPENDIQAGLNYINQIKK